MKKRYVIATIKSWNVENAKKLIQRYPEYEFIVISEKEKLTIERLNEISPEFIFFPHWSWYISSTIFTQYRCVVFHETDLPFGRGGSPIQNLIVRGIYQTKITAIKVTENLDAGDIYLKEDFDISTGNVEEILRQASDIIFNKMIPIIIENEPTPVPQTGEPVVFQRRKPSQSEIPAGFSSREVYDYIRMLDGEGYPTAFLKTDYGNVYLKNAKFKNGKLTADAFFEGGDN